MITSSLLEGIEEAAEGILVLVDGLQEPEFRRSRLTRREVRRLLADMAAALEALGASWDVQAAHALPEIDWDGWRATARRLRAMPSQPPAAADADAEADEAAWFAATSMVPATLSWLRLYRRTQPALFAFRAPGPPSAR